MGSWFWTIKIEIVDVNPAMGQMLGVDLKMMLGKNIELIFADWPDILARFRNILDTQTEISTDDHYLGLRISPLKDRFDKPTGRLVVVRDITAQKQVEKALEASEKNLRRMLESAPDAMLIVDRIGNITFANTQSEIMFGYPREKLLHQLIEDLLPASFAEIHKEHRESYFKDPTPRSMGKRSDMNLIGKRRDGTEFPVEISLSPIIIEEGIFVIAAVRDMTERQQTENKLRLQAAALNSAANAIMITDIHDVIQWVNPAFIHLTGYSELDVIGKNPTTLRSGKHDLNFYKTMYETPRSGRVWRGEVLNRHKDGSEYIEDQTITPVYDRDDMISHFISIKQDITERRRAEDALRQAEYKYRTLVEQMPAVLYIDGLDDIEAEFMRMSALK